jgi:hypothetical protein
LVQPTQDAIQCSDQDARTSLAVAAFHHIANVVKIVNNDQVMRFEGFVQSCGNAFFDGQRVKGLDFVKKIGQAQQVTSRFEGKAFEHKAAAMAIGYAQPAQTVLMKLTEQLLINCFLGRA